ncbi:MAG: DEAD/DEAH box helicase [Bacteroidetes bacterium]|nr:DEAD/DEAH box helicase [Bacteroidota bacterium]
MKTDRKQLLQNFGIENLLPMQEDCLTKFKKPGDFVLYSPTGSGKTLGFLLPIIESLTNQLTTQALIVTPTRELGLQIEQVFKNCKTGFKVACFYGGHPIREELRSLEAVPQVLIGTPGRLLDHLDRQSIDLRNVKTLVLDEFDKSLEFGFQNELEQIMNASSWERRVFCSATVIEEFPEFIELDVQDEINYLVESQNKVELYKKSYEEEEKIPALMEVICTLKGKTLVFCNHREATDRLVEHLNENGIPAIAFHGKLEQEERERRLIQFRNGSRDYMIATDLAARGLDIEEIVTVVHYQLPVTEQTLAHRNGRVGRMHNSGKIVAMFSVEKPNQKNEFLQDLMNWKELKTHTNIELPELPEWETLYFSGGKKEKINKIDLVGFLSKVGELKQGEIGVISVLDHSSYVAVKRDKIRPLLKKLQGEKVKGKKLKIAIAM